MPRKPRRISHETALALDVFLEDPGRSWYGLELVDSAGIPAGSVYPILIRLEERAILISKLEDESVAHLAGRRQRRYYRLAPGGIDKARAELAEWRAAVDRRRIVARPTLGQA